jgi:hypothetical protein
LPAFQLDPGTGAAGVFIAAIEDLCCLKTNVPVNQSLDVHPFENRCCSVAAGVFEQYTVETGGGSQTRTSKIRRSASFSGKIEQKKE